MASSMAEMAGALRGAGAEALAMVSNSAHAAGDMIQRASGLPLIDMISAASTAAREAGARRVGVLGSKASLRLYREYLAAQAMGQVSLPPDRQEAFVVAMARLRRGERGPAMRQRMNDFATDLMAQGAEVVIVGAVDAALVLDIGDFRGELIDPTEMLARRCVAVCLGFDPLPAVLT
jgi:aspartate racemase